MNPAELKKEITQLE